MYIELRQAQIVLLFMNILETYHLWSSMMDKNI